MDTREFPLQSFVFLEDVIACLCVHVSVSVCLSVCLSHCSQLDTDVFLLSPCLEYLACFKKNEGRNVPGGNIQSSINNLTECARLCLTDALGVCYAFDFVDRSNQCWFHFSPISGRVRTAVGIDHYARIPSCGNDHFCGCLCAWSLGVCQN